MVAGCGSATPAGSWKVTELPVGSEFDLGDSADHVLNPGISGAEHDGTGGAKAVLHQLSPPRVTGTSLLVAAAPLYMVAGVAEAARIISCP